MRGRNLKLPGYFSPTETPVDTECSAETLRSSIAESDALIEPNGGPLRPLDTAEIKKGFSYIFNFSFYLLFNFLTIFCYFLERSHGRRLQRTKQSYDFDESPVLESKKSHRSGIPQGTVQGHQRVDAEEDSVNNQKSDKDDRYLGKSSKEL